LRYPDGREMHLGDRVDQDGRLGRVVCSIDTGEYSNAYTEAHWSYLGVGVLIEFDDIGLVHYGEPDESIRFLGRGATDVIPSG
jgi:hypothetical protein